jgi:hypothetical protein
MRIDHDIITRQKWLFLCLATWILGGLCGGRKQKVV